MQFFTIVTDKIIDVLTSQLPWIAGMAVLFTVLGLFRSQACNPGTSWWKNRGLVTDLQYSFLLPIIMPYFRVTILASLMALIWGQMSEASVQDFLDHGRGPLSTLPFVAQAAIFMLGVDFLSYWLHRIFHDGHFWPFHAVHHSSEDLDWTSTYRAHPVDSLMRNGLSTAIMLALGIPMQVAVFLIPFDILSAAFVHANLNWSLGPLRYLVATPLFHRWHHTSPAEGGNMNFASTFSIWDWMFGTFYMPKGKLPVEYGVDDPNFPQDIVGQMIVPFKQSFGKFRSQKVT